MRDAKYYVGQAWAALYAARETTDDPDSKASIQELMEKLDGIDAALHYYVEERGMK